jgi:PAS domain S-box-containing protein
MSTPPGRVGIILEKILETSPTGIVVLNGNHEIALANDRAVGLLGAADEDELIGVRYDAADWKPLDSSGDPLPGDELPYAEVLESREPVYAREIGITNAAGERQWLSVGLAPILEDDAVAGVVASFNDVTELRSTQQSLSKQRERLEAISSVIAHDLRNPLGIIDGYAELIQETGELEHLAQIRTAVDRMEAIIDDMLTLARVGAQAVETEPVELEEAVETAWGNVGTDAATLVCATGATFEADRSLLLQLFENLFRNSVEHAGTDVTVTADALPDGDGFLVEDDGPGIPPGQRADVFSFGYSSESEGTGLGLAIVRQVADVNGWEVAVEDGTDGGARFEIRGVEPPAA